MQPQPTSVMLSADAYRQELLADAARAQPVRPNGVVGQGGPTPLSRVRRTVGLALLWAGERAAGIDARRLAGDVAAVCAGPDPACPN